MASWISINGLGPLWNVLVPMVAAMDPEDQATKDTQTMVDNGLVLLSKMWKRFHNFVLIYKAAPLLLEFLANN